FDGESEVDHGAYRGSVIEFRPLGRVDLRGHEGTPATSILAQPKRIALLAYLATAKGDACHRRDTLLGIFWPELDTEHARASLRKSLHLLRRSLGDDVVISIGAG